MKTSPRGLALIEQFEGLKLQAYQDQAGIFTIGFGHANAHQGQFETQEQAQDDLCADLGTAEEAVSRLVQVPVNQNQFDALVSFTFNEGQGRLKGSTMLRLLNSGNPQLAANEFPKWDIVAGTPSEGLLRRRVAEQTLFLTPEAST